MTENKHKVSWHYYDSDRQKQGPITSGQMKELAGAGVIMPETVIETEDGKRALAQNLKGLEFPETTSEPAPLELTTPESAGQLSTEKPDLSAPPAAPAGSSENLVEQKPLDEVNQDDEEQSDTFDPSLGDEIPASDLEPTRDVAERILSELQPILATLNEKVETLTRDADFWKQLVVRKEEQIDNLHEENRQYRDDVIGRFRDKIVQVVIGQLDGTERQIKAFIEKGESEKTYTNLLDSFTKLVEAFRDGLANLGITAYKTNEGEPLNEERHKVGRSEATGEKEKVKTIIRSTRYGYKREDGTILRPEFVDIYHYDAKLDIPAEISQDNVEIPQNTDEQTSDVVSPNVETTENES